MSFRRARFLISALLLGVLACQSQSNELIIVTLGDSLTEGVRYRVPVNHTYPYYLQENLEQAGVKTQVVNVGIGGERTDQALARIESVIQLRPDIVTIMYGTNDSYVDPGKTQSRVSRSAYVENLKTIISILKQHDIKPILMTPPTHMTVNRMDGLGEDPNLRLMGYADACRDVARDANVELVDHFVIWHKALEAGLGPRDWTVDGIHAKAVGNQELAKAMHSAVLRVIDSI